METETLSTTATLYNPNGCIMSRNVTVERRTEHKYSATDSMLIVNGSAHALSDIDDSEDGLLTSLAAGWYITL